MATFFVSIAKRVDTDIFVLYIDWFYSLNRSSHTDEPEFEIDRILAYKLNVFSFLNVRSIKLTIKKAGQLKRPFSIKYLIHC